MNEYLLQNIDLILIVLGWCVSIYILSNKIEKLETQQNIFISSLCLYFTGTLKSIMNMSEDELRKFREELEKTNPLGNNPPPTKQHQD